MVTYLERPIYDFGQVDRLLGLTSGTARRWIDGYERSGTFYTPIVREERTGQDVVTWGEFVETRLLAYYRDCGVGMIKMRPVVQNLREVFGVRYPLATIRPYLLEDLRLVYDVQERVGLEESLRLVVEAGTNQLVLAPQTREFERTSVFEAIDGEDVVARVMPLGQDRTVSIDPGRQFGDPVVRSTPTDVLASLVRAGESVEWVAEQYELDVEQVLDAIEYERRRKQATAAA